MTQFDLSSNEYLVEITDSNFQLNFVVDDIFYNKEFAAVSVKEIVTQGVPNRIIEDYKQIIKITSRNRSYPVFDKLVQVKTVKVNLALFELEVHTNRARLFSVNSPPTVLPIISKKIDFELIELLTDKPINFHDAYCERMFVRFVISPVGRR